MLRNQKRCFLTKICLFCFLTLLLVKTLVFWSIFGQKTSFFMRVNFLRKKIKKYFFPSFCHLNIAPRCVKIAQNNYDIYYWRFSRNTLQCTDKNRIMHQNAQWRLLMQINMQYLIMAQSEPLFLRKNSNSVSLMSGCLNRSYSYLETLVRTRAFFGWKSWQRRASQENYPEHQ